MDIEEAKRRLETAEHRLRGCNAELDRADREWATAQKSRGDNRLWYRLRRTHGDGFMKMFKDDKDHALRVFRRALEERDKAKADYERLIVDEANEGGD